MNIYSQKNYKMKTIGLTSILILLFTTFSLQLKAQENESNLSKKKFELGVSYSGSGVGLDVKKHWKNNKYFRLSNARIGLSTNSEPILVSFETGLNVGIENRNYLSEKWWLSYGPELGVQFSNFNFQGTNRNIFEIDFGYFLGINYDITDRISVGTELKASVFSRRTIQNSSLWTTPVVRTNWGIKPTGKVNLTYRF